MFNFNSWFANLPEGRQEVLRENRWMLAEAAFSAGARATRASVRVLDFHKRDKGIYLNGEHVNIELCHEDRFDYHSINGSGTFYYTSAEKVGVDRDTLELHIESY